MNNETKTVKPLLLEGHKRPSTRRDFLAQGFIGFSAVAFAPTIPTLLFRASKAYAQQAATNPVPFLVVDMAGGAALPGNFLVGKDGGPEDFLKSYNILGWDPRAAGALNKDFGLPMAANVSMILRGILETASAQARAGFRMGSICNFSRDDTSSNELSAISLVAKAGLTGSVIPTGIGMFQTVSGGNSRGALEVASMKPVQISTVTDLQNSVSFGRAFQGFSAMEMVYMGAAMMGISKEQARKYLGAEKGPELEKLSNEAYERNSKSVSEVPQLDPRAVAAYQQIYGIDANTPDSDFRAVSAAITMNLMSGAAGPSVITLGGCDYHTGRQQEGDERDLEAGRVIGRAVEAAFRAQKPLFIELLTDGGTYATEGTRNWLGDAGDKSMTIMGYYDPMAPKAQRRLQVGRYTDGQGADNETFLGADPAKVALAVFSNYLNINKRLGEFNNLVPGNVFSPAQLDALQIWE